MESRDDAERLENDLQNLWAEEKLAAEGFETEDKDDGDDGAQREGVE